MNEGKKRFKAGKDNLALTDALSLAWELGYTIAIPIIVFVLLGRWVDIYFKTSPIFILVGTTLSLFVSGYLIYIKTTQIFAELEESIETPKTKKTTKSKVKKK